MASAANRTEKTVSGVWLAWEKAVMNNTTDSQIRLQQMRTVQREIHAEISEDDQLLIARFWLLMEALLDPKPMSLEGVTNFNRRFKYVSENFNKIPLKYQTIFTLTSKGFKKNYTNRASINQVISNNTNNEQTTVSSQNKEPQFEKINGILNNEKHKETIETLLNRYYTTDWENGKANTSIITIIRKMTQSPEGGEDIETTEILRKYVINYISFKYKYPINSIYLKETISNLDKFPLEYQEKFKTVSQNFNNIINNKENEYDKIIPVIDSNLENLEKSLKKSEQIATIEKSIEQILSGKLDNKSKFVKTTLSDIHKPENNKKYFDYLIKLAKASSQIKCKYDFYIDDITKDIYHEMVSKLEQLDPATLTKISEQISTITSFDSDSLVAIIKNISQYKDIKNNISENINQKQWSLEDIMGIWSNLNDTTKTLPHILRDEIQNEFWSQVNKPNQQDKINTLADTIYKSDNKNLTEEQLDFLINFIHNLSDKQENSSEASINSIIQRLKILVKIYRSSNSANTNPALRHSLHIVNSDIMKLSLQNINQLKGEINKIISSSDETILDSLNLITTTLWCPKEIQNAIREIINNNQDNKKNQPETPNKIDDKKNQPKTTNEIDDKKNQPETTSKTDNQDNKKNQPKTPNKIDDKKNEPKTRSNIDNRSSQAETTSKTYNQDNKKSQPKTTNKIFRAIKNFFTSQYNKGNQGKTSKIHPLITTQSRDNKLPHKTIETPSSLTNKMEKPSTEHTTKKVKSTLF